MLQKNRILSEAARLRRLADEQFEERRHMTAAERAHFDRDGFRETEDHTLHHNALFAVAKGEALRKRSAGDIDDEWPGCSVPFWC